LVLWKQSFRRRPPKNVVSKISAMKLQPQWSRNNCEIKWSEQENSPWLKQFTDLSKPLVIDLGCGMGLSLLGLASLSMVENKTDHNIQWSNYNYIGVDLSPLTVNYARSVASRWGITDRLCFVVDDAEGFLDKIRLYQGGVHRIMIQFPTPFHLTIPSSVHDSRRNFSMDGIGNSRLPKSFHEGFMVTRPLLTLASELLKTSEGELLIQSNCEDVAVRIRQLALDVPGFTCRSSDFVHIPAGTDTLRTVSWIAMGGQRATGIGWSANPILPTVGRTETEIACIMNDVPVHRCLLTIR
jgi:tRNA G46 methylase TrmB